MIKYHQTSGYLRGVKHHTAQLEEANGVYNELMVSDG